MTESKDRLSKLARDLSDPVAIPDEGIDRAVEIMRSGRMHRYGKLASPINTASALITY